MAKTIQKKIKFSKGQITPRLVERTDLAILDSSCAYAKNVIPTLYGGIKSRYGTKLIDEMVFGSTEVIGTATSSVGTPTNLQTTGFTTDGIESNRILFSIDYTTAQAAGQFKLYGIKFNYTAAKIYLTCSYTGSPRVYYVSGVSINTAGVGATAADYFIAPITGWTTQATFSKTINNSGVVTGVAITGAGSGPSNIGQAIITRVSAPRVYPATLYGSADGTTWVSLGQRYITETSQDFAFDVGAGYRYIKFELDTTADSITTTITMGKSSFYSVAEVETDLKVIEFYYNNADKYIMVLGNEMIRIYKDDAFVYSVGASGLLEAYFPKLKYTYKDDTIIFTHPNMYPKVLKRTPTTQWEWAEFTLENIPYRLFGDTTTSSLAGLTPNATNAVVISAATAVFTSAMVGQVIEGNSGTFKITGFSTATRVTGYCIIPFADTSAFGGTLTSGYELVWSATRGYPNSCMFAQQRLWFGGSKNCPSTIWASKLGDYNNFANQYNDDNDAINGADLLTNESIVNLSNNRDIHIFTTGNVWKNSINNTTPSTFNPVKQCDVGSYDNVLPTIIDGQIIFADSLGKNLYSYVFNYNEDAYNSSNLSILNDLMDEPLAISAEIDSLNDKNNYLYVVKSDGTMLINSLKMSQDINATTQFITDGNIKDVCGIGGYTYIVAERNNKYYLEKIADYKTDCTSVVTINGTSIANLPKGFNDKYVWVYNDNEVLGKYLVEEQTITFGSTVIGIYNVGINFDFEIEGNNIAINGQTLGKKKRISKAQLVTYNTNHITFCDKEKIQENKDVFDFYACTSYKNNIQYTIKGEFYPFELLSLQLWINYGDL